MQKYSPKAAKKAPLKLVKTGNDDPGKLGNLECRKQVFAFLAAQKLKPDSTKDADMVPWLEEVAGPAPDDIDDVSDAYVWMVLTLVDQGKLKLPSLAYKAWCGQPRVKLVRAFMNSVQNDDCED